MADLPPDIADGVEWLLLKLGLQTYDESSLQTETEKIHERLRAELGP